MAFDPSTQNITLLAPDGSTPILIPIPLINQWNDETISITLNYGTQLGACITALLAVLLLTSPSTKLTRPSSVLHILGLLVCIVRMVLLVVYFLTPFSHFYQVWGQDYSQIPQWNFRLSVAGTVFSLLLLMVTEAALMYQAWTMVSLWPGRTKHVLSAVSAVVALVTVAVRFASTVIQAQYILDTTTSVIYAWLSQASVITNTVSICWFCAIFNLKLVSHLLKNRGVLPSRRAMNPMEVLVMANGILMIVPVIFCILEWRHFINFESGSLTQTAVAIILPLGSLTAQRMAQPRPPSSNSSDFSCPSNGGVYKGWTRDTSDRGSRAPLKPSSPFSTTLSNGSSVAGIPQISIISHDDEDMLPHQAEKGVSY